MNLSKSLKALVIDRFKTGASIEEIAKWYGQKPAKIEAVIRDAMLWQDNMLAKDFQKGGEMFAAATSESLRKIGVIK
jgi:hypothetical protein